MSITSNSFKFQKFSHARLGMVDKLTSLDGVMGDAEMMKMKEHAGLGEKEWRRALAEAR